MAAEDGVGVVYSGAELVEAVSWREDGAAWHVALGSDGLVSEQRVAARRV